MPRDTPTQFSPIKDTITNFGARVGGGLSSALYPGGLDLLTPSQRLHSGALRDVLNFECSLNGGYGRIPGYERFNGMAAPSDATFVFVQVATFVTVPSVGERISQANSGATGTVALVNNAPGAYYMIVTQTAGTFNTTDIISSAPTTYTITEAGGPLIVTAANSPFIFPTSVIVVIGTAITPTVQVTAQLNAQFQVAAADVYRALILAVPGSGNVTGVVHMIFNGVDNVYAFRTNVAGNAVNIYKSSINGWVLVPFYNTVSFTGGGTAPALDGDTLTQGATTATIKRVMVQTGQWSGSAAGQFVITTPTMGLAAGPATTSSGATVTLSGASTPITLLPGGIFEFVKCNFYGQLSTRRIYGCDGVNKCFELGADDVLSPITTGLSPDAPSHITYHRNFLFVSLASSISYCGAGTPFMWSSINGGGEIACSDTVNGMLTMPGAQNTSTLGVWMRSTTGILYGNDPTNFNFTIYNIGVGGIAGSIQNLYDTFAFAEPGVITLQTTLNFGNFEGAALTKNIQPFINQQRSKITTSSVSHIKGQYRVFFNDGYGLWLSTLNQQYIGAAIVQFPNPVLVCDVDTNTIGGEVSYFGSNDGGGYVYHMDTGPSFDGATLFAYVTLAWDYFKSPEFLKQYRRARLELQGTAYAAMSFGYGLSDNSPLVGQPSATSYASSFSPAIWDSFTWDNFFWDGQTIAPTYVSLDGTGYDIQPVIGSTTNYIQPFNLNSIIYQYSERRRLRGM